MTTLTSRTAGVDHFTPAQLLRTAQLFTTDPELPRLIELASGERQWRRLAQTPYLQIWLLAWPAGTTTDWHDHGTASGAFHTVLGTLTEESWIGSVQTREIAAGEGRAFGSRHIHGVTNRSASTALSVHAYSPALSEMTRYAVDGHRLVRLGVDRAGEQW
jgi:hypothetical protein